MRHPSARFVTWCDVNRVSYLCQLRVEETPSQILRVREVRTAPLCHLQVHLGVKREFSSELTTEQIRLVHLSQ